VKPVADFSIPGELGERDENGRKTAIQQGVKKWIPRTPSARGWERRTGKVTKKRRRGADSIYTVAWSKKGRRRTQ